MSKPIELPFEKTPSSLITLWKAFRSRKSYFDTIDSVPIYNARRYNIAINKKHYRDFCAICKTNETEHLPIIYPFTIVYPYIMLVLSNKMIPFSMFGILNTRNSMIMHRGIRQDETLSVSCLNSAIRIVEKGTGDRCTIRNILRKRAGLGKRNNILSSRKLWD